MAFEHWNVKEPETFWKSHVFASAATYWNDAFQSAQTLQMTNAAQELDAIWSVLPVAWTSLEENITKQSIYDLLWRFTTDTDTFWSEHERHGH